MKLAPSILSADFSNLTREIDTVTPAADWLHVDVMDGHFVPPITIGAPVVQSIRRQTDLFLDCHLMVEKPSELAKEFADAGADGVTFHIELGDPTGTIKTIRDLGLKVGLSLNPPTPFADVAPYLDQVDLILVMSVNPGWGGQSFMPEVLEKVEAARKIIDQRGLGAEIEIDGGISAETAPLATAAGADILVAGSAIFRSADPLKAAQQIRGAAWPDAQ